MVRKQPGSATELKTVDPEPKTAEPPAAASPAASHKSPTSPDSADSAGAAASADAAAPTPAAKRDVAAPASAEPEPAGRAPGAAPDAARDADDEARPPPPPRPKPERRVSGFSSNLGELRAAFPEADEGVLRAVLVAASNNLEAAFTGMLAMTDATIRPAAYINEQIERDARLARRLAESQARRERPARRSSHGGAPRAARGPAPHADDELAGDDLYDGFQRGLSDTKQVVSSFWGSLKQRISNEVYDDDVGPEYADDEREPARDQWWPRQPAGQPAGRDNPPLPPRKAGARGAPRDARPEAREPRSVNAFGDDTAAQRKQWEPVAPAEPEPDAFFIGESDDDDDLGSLDEAAPRASAARTKDAGAADDAKETKLSGTAASTEPATKEPATKEPATKEPATKEPATKDGASTEPASTEPATKDGATKDGAETPETRERRASTAKDLLNKLKLEASEKAKTEDKS